MLIKKMIFKWTPGFCLSRSWQAREQPLAHLRAVELCHFGGRLSTVCLGTGRVLTSAGTAVEESLRPAPYSKSELVSSFLLPGC